MADLATLETQLYSLLLSVPTLATITRHDQSGLTSDEAPNQSISKKGSLL